MSGRKNDPNRNPNPPNLNEEIKKPNKKKKAELINAQNQPQNNSDPFPFLELPLDLLKQSVHVNKKGEVIVLPTSNISHYLTYNDIRSLTCVSKNPNSIFKNERQAEKEVIKKFLTHVVRGEKAQAEEMIKRDPRLLLEKIKVKDEAGRTIYGTAYQIALGAKDVSPYPDQFEEMAEMIERYLLQLPNGEEERNKQYNEQFPEGFEKQEEARRMSDSLALNKVFAAIKKDKTTDLAEANKAVAEFQNYLENQVKGVITTGYHFNEALFQEALKLYDEHYNDFGGYYGDKNRLSAIKLIGFIERFFPVNLAQAARDLFRKVVDEKKALSRSKLLDDKKTSFFDSNLVATHYVYSYEVHTYVPFLAGVHRCVAEALAFHNVVSSKNNNLIKLQSIVTKREPRKDPSIFLIQ